VSVVSEVRQFLTDFITDEFDVPATEVHDHTELIGDLGFDSLAFASSVSEIRHRFDVVLSVDDILECRTLGSLAGLVESRRPATAGAAMPAETIAEDP
jgi:acyl carrier protein